MNRKTTPPAITLPKTFSPDQKHLPAEHLSASKHTPEEQRATRKGKKRQDFFQRSAVEKSLLDGALRRGCCELGR
jgi:hypothetical protein